MTKIIEFLKGKKTYILAVAGVLYAITGLITGHMTADQAIELIFGSGIAASIRSGINSNKG